MTTLTPYRDMRALHIAAYLPDASHVANAQVDAERNVRTKLDPYRFEQVVAAMPDDLQTFIQYRYGEQLPMETVARRIGQSVDMTYHFERRALDYLRHDATKRRYEYMHREVFDELDARCVEAERVASDTDRLYTLIGHLLEGRITRHQVLLRHVGTTRPDRLREETPLAFLSLTRRDYNIFRRLHFETVEDVLRYGSDALLDERSIGKTYVKRITDLFATHGFTLTRQPQDLPRRREYVPAQHLPAMQTTADIDSAVAALMRGDIDHITVDIYPQFIDTWTGVLTLTGRK